MAAMMQRRLGAKLRTADDYATADEKEIKELSAMTGIKYKPPARRPQPKRIAAPASTPDAWPTARLKAWPKACVLAILDEPSALQLRSDDARTKVDERIRMHG